MVATKNTTRVVRIEDVRVIRHSERLKTPSIDYSLTSTKPTNQGECGSCWAISTTQCLRDRINMYRRKHNLPDIPELSFQFIIDCSKNCVTYNGRKGCALECNGGFLVTSFLFLRDVGTPKEHYHPNRHSDQNGLDHLDSIDHSNRRSCPEQVNPEEPLYRCQDFYNVHIYEHTFGITNARSKPRPMTRDELSKNANNIANEIAKNGPVAVCFNLYSDFKDFWNHPNSANMIYRIGWNLPKSVRDEIDPVGSVHWSKSSPHHGIYFKTGHSISIVGYGTQYVPGEGMVDYWVCRNSWGTPHNTYNKGFFKIWRGINASAIEADVGAPEVSEKFASDIHVPDKDQRLAPSTSSCFDKDTPPSDNNMDNNMDKNMDQNVMILSICLGLFLLLVIILSKS